MAKLTEASVSVVIKLASLAVHAEEFLDMQEKGDARAGQFDIESIRGLLRDQQVREVLDDPENAVFLPVKRDAG